jgi:hypothetical protein
MWQRRTTATRWRMVCNARDSYKGGEEMKNELRGEWLGGGKKRQMERKQ